MRVDTRILGFGPSQRGFGYVVVSNHGELLEWRTAEVRPLRNPAILSRLERLLDRIRPDVMIIEDRRGPGCYRRFRVLELLGQVEEIAKNRG